MLENVQMVKLVCENKLNIKYMFEIMHKVKKIREIIHNVKNLLNFDVIFYVVHIFRSIFEFYSEFFFVKDSGTEKRSFQSKAQKFAFFYTTPIVGKKKSTKND